MVLSNTRAVVFLALVLSASASMSSSSSSSSSSEEPYVAVCTEFSCGFTYKQKSFHPLGECSVVDNKIKCKCNEGYDGDYCDDCKAGYYDYPNCARCKNQGIWTGSECRCVGNWGGSLCDVCRGGFYGQSCEHQAFNGLSASLVTLIVFVTLITIAALLWAGIMLWRKCAQGRASPYQRLSTIEGSLLDSEEK
eukprot:TRINITY_DN26470_c0_g1_i1.p1 TRINITY_DN26470_c0_g1~~TRINITY_DN26470_c0_g1_i1.p1  ORF type:complete len:193 (-),score=19.52 TRINITY_DN26470_c0_g1_i1:18-596(-)